MKTKERNTNGSTQQVSQDLPKIEIAQFHIVGLSPLLTDRFDPDWLINPQPKDKSHEAMFQDSIYWTTDNKLGYPASGIKSCLSSAARFTSQKINKMKSLLFVLEQDVATGLVYLIADDPQMQVDTVITNRGTKQLAVSAKFWPWEMVFDVQYDRKQIRLEDVAAQVIAGGEHIGLGYRRVESGDNRRLGRFQIA